jgi:hypothetical protein
MPRPGIVHTHSEKPDTTVLVLVLLATARPGAASAGDMGRPDEAKAMRGTAQTAVNETGRDKATPLTSAKATP